MAANLRGTPGNDTLVVATADTNYLGMAGDDTYIIDSDRVQAGDTININDTQGANRIQLVGGLEIVSSQVATLESGVSQLFLTLSNGTNVLVNGASNFSFDVGGLFGGDGAVAQSFAELTETLGYDGVPAAGEQAAVEEPVVIDDQPEPPEPPRPEDEFTVEDAIAAGDNLPAEYVIRDTAGNLLGNLDLPIVSEASLLELSAPASVAQAGSLLEVSNFSSEYALLDSLARMEAAPAVFIGAREHTLTNDPGDLGTLNAEQVAIVESATNVNEYSWTPSEPQPSEGETFTLTQQADDLTPNAEDPANRPTDEDTLFRAPVTQNETGSGQLANTFETGDVLDGAGGDNTLRADLIATGTVSDGFQGAAISATTNNIQDVYLRAQTPQVDLSDNTTPGSTIDAENMSGVRQWWTDNSRSHVQIEDIRTAPETTTFGMTETDPDVGYRAYFNPRALDGVINDSLLTIQIAELDGGVIDTGAQLQNIRVEALRFTLNGEEETLRSDAMADANTWLALRDAIIDELAEKGLDNIEVDLLSEGQYRLFDTQGGSFSDQGGFTATADTDRQIDIRNRIEQETPADDPTESTAILDAAGNGSTGGGLDIGVMSGDRGIEILNLEVTNQDSHLTQVVSNNARSDAFPLAFPRQNDYLERIDITPHEAGDQGDLRVNNLWDVQTIDARLDGQVFNGFLDLNVTLNDFNSALIQDYFQRLGDDETANFVYRGGDGGNRLSFNVDDDVASDPDFRMSITGGHGDDHIVIRNDFELRNVSIDADPRVVNPDSENTLTTFADINTNPATTPVDFDDIQTLVLRDNDDGTGTGTGVDANLSGQLASVENLLIATGGDTYDDGDTTITALQPNQSVSISGENQIGGDINGDQIFGTIDFENATVNTLAVNLDNAARVDGQMIIGALDVTGSPNEAANSAVRTLDLHSNGERDTSNAVQGLNAAAVTTLNLHGTQDLSVRVADLASEPENSDDETPALTVDGSDLEGDLTLGFQVRNNREGNDDRLVGTDGANDTLALYGDMGSDIDNDLAFNANVSGFERVQFGWQNGRGFGVDDALGNPGVDDPSLDRSVDGHYDAANDAGVSTYQIAHVGAGGVQLYNLGNNIDVVLGEESDPANPGSQTIGGPVTLNSSNPQNTVNIEVLEEIGLASPINIVTNEYRAVNVDVQHDPDDFPGDVLSLNLNFDPQAIIDGDPTTARDLNVDADIDVNLSGSTFVDGMNINTGGGDDVIDMRAGKLVVDAGDGADEFVYTAASNSPSDARDTIRGFQAEGDDQDVLDIQGLLAAEGFSDFELLDPVDSIGIEDVDDAYQNIAGKTPASVLYALYNTDGEVLYFDTDKDGAITSADLSIRLRDLNGELTEADNFVTGPAPGPDIQDPVVTAGQSFNIADDAADGTDVGTVLATDNVGVTGFAITGGNVDVDGDGNLPFAIDNAGVISVTDTDDLVDGDPSDPFSLTVEASDAAGNTGTGTVTVDVTSTADTTPPVITTATLEVVAGAALGETVGIAATDNVGVTSASITAGNVDVDGDGTLPFAVDATGVITVADPDDLVDGGANDPFTLTVEAGDDAGNTATGDVTVDVIADSEAPVITTGQSFDVAENAADGSTVGTVAASDNVAITAFDITAGNVDVDGDGTLPFAIDSNGEITVTDTDDLIDGDASDPFTLSLAAEDAAGNVGTGDITVNVTAVAPPAGEDLDALGGTLTDPATFDAGTGPFTLVDSGNSVSNTEVSNFGLDDSITFTDMPTDPAVSVSDGNTQFEFVTGTGDASVITLLGVSGFFTNIAQFNADPDYGDATVA